MCAPSWDEKGPGKYGAPAIRATLSPGFGLRDMERTISGRPRDGSNFVLDAMEPDIPAVQAPTRPPQQARQPDSAPLQRRNNRGAGGIAVPSGSTMLSGAGGVTGYPLGGATLLGG